ncbi:MAG: hypothetical protein AAGG38_11785, partial [Planctomycetota bacterium]
MSAHDSAAPAPLAASLTPPAPRRGLGQALLWACFLGCSWTWVIGMFLPVMMLRDFGVMGWVAFAVPNVLGAAAMGFVLARPETSWALTRKHPGALRAFASVTIAYQIYVVFWLFSGLWLALIWVIPWLVLDRVRREKLGRWLPPLAVAVAVLSWGAFSMAGRLDGAWLDVGFSPARDVLPDRLAPTDLWFLAPGYLAGFLLCPYLDPTFHRARYSTTPRTGQAAFALGFVVVFGSMILFSLMYAGLLRPLINQSPGFTLAPPWKVLLALHIGAQVAFTLMAHSRERFAVVDPKDRAPLVWFALLIVAALAWATVSRLSPATLGSLTLGEVGYRAFLLIYGVFFPGYALICMLPPLKQLLQKPLDPAPHPHPANPPAP